MTASATANGSEPPPQTTASGADEVSSTAFIPCSVKALIGFVLGCFRYRQAPRLSRTNEIDDAHDQGVARMDLGRRGDPVCQRSGTEEDIAVGSVDRLD